MSNVNNLVAREIEDTEQLAAHAAARLTELSETGTGTSSEQEELKVINLQVDRYRERIRELKQTLNSTKFDAPASKSEEQERNDVFRRWASLGARALDEGERREFINDENGRFRMALPRIDARPGGPYPVGVQSRVIERLAYEGSVRRACYEFSTADGNDILLPQADNTTQRGRRLLTEVALGTAPGRGTQSDVNQFSDIRFRSHVYTSDPTAINKVALQDANIDLNRFISAALARRIGTIQNEEFTLTSASGTDAQKPEGIVTGATAKLTSATGAGGRVWHTSTDPVEDRLIDLIYSLDKAYRDDQGEGVEYGNSDPLGGATGFMMSDGAFAQLVRSTKDENRRSMLLSYERGYTVGFRPVLLGWPVFINNDMASPAANGAFAVNDVIALFGNFDHYWVRDVNMLEYLRYEDSNYAEVNCVGFQAFVRTDARYVGPIVNNACEAVVSYVAAGS